jgi:hypothetical protein
MIRCRWLSRDREYGDLIDTRRQVDVHSTLSSETPVHFRDNQWTGWNARNLPLHYPQEGDWMHHFPRTRPDTTYIPGKLGHAMLVALVAGQDDADALAALTLRWVRVKIPSVREALRAAVRTCKP